MGYLELKLYEICTLQFDTQISTYIQDNFFRYIDDCFLIWDSTFGDIDSFTNLLNNLHPSINFIYSGSKTSVSFLDIVVYHSNHIIHSDIHYKTTDSMRILPFHSKHPRHILRNIPYTFFKRIDLLVSDDLLKNSRKEELKCQLLDHGYPLSLITDAMNKIYFATGPRSKSNLFPIVLTYNSSTNYSFYSNIKTCIQNLSFYPCTSGIIENKKLLLAYKRGYGLLNFLSSRTNIIRKCSEPRCKTCPIIQTGPSINLPNRNRILPNFPMSCKSSHLIYCLVCTKCFLIYIGKTSIPLRQRITLHRQHTLHPNYALLKVNKHFNNCNKSFLVTPIYKLPNNVPDSILLFVESYFIELLTPELNCK